MWLLEHTAIALAFGMLILFFVLSLGVRALTRCVGGAGTFRKTIFVHPTPLRRRVARW